MTDQVQVKVPIEAIITVWSQAVNGCLASGNWTPVEAMAKADEVVQGAIRRFFAPGQVQVASPIVVPTPRLVPR